MKLLTDILVLLVALEFCFIFYLESVRTSSARTASVFGMEEGELKRPSVDLLFKNQGVYNLVIALMLILGAFVFHSPLVVLLFFALFLANIIVVAAYGAISSSPRIFPMQAGLAVIAAICLAIGKAV